MGYAFNDHHTTNHKGNYEKLVSGHGDTDTYSTATMAHTGHFTGDAGLDLQVVSIKAGLKGNF